jgi:hypothetical protein
MSSAVLVWRDGRPSSGSMPGLPPAPSGLTDRMPVSAGCPTDSRPYAVFMRARSARSDSRPIDPLPRDSDSFAMIHLPAVAICPQQATDGMRAIRGPVVFEPTPPPPVGGVAFLLSSRCGTLLASTSTVLALEVRGFPMATASAPAPSTEPRTVADARLIL